MDNSLLANTYVKRILMHDEEIVNALTDDTTGTRIYPGDAHAGSKFPFVVIHRNTVEPQYTKDGCFENNVSTTVFIIDNAYDEGLAIANNIRNRLDLCRYSDEDIYISRIELTGAAEYVVDNTFVQELTFNLEISN